MYKMITFDIDGTLVPHLSNELAPEIVDMFKKLKEKNYVVTLATGRDFVSIADIYKNPYVDYYIGANGSFIYDLKKEEYILNSSIKYDDFKKYDKEIIQENLFKLKTVILSEPNNVYVKEQVDKSMDAWFWNSFRFKFKNYELADTELDRLHFHLITIEFPEHSNILELTENFFKKTNSSLCVQAWWPKGMFIANKGITKAHSIKLLCEKLGIKMKEVIAFGDGENDLEMINEVGLGIAMGNAVDKLKKIADDETIDVKEFGTKFYLEKLGII